MQTADPAAVDAVLLGLITVGRLMRQRRARGPARPRHLLAAEDDRSTRARCGSATSPASVHLDPSTVSRHVSQMERTGLIARTPDPDDGRAQLVAITDEGQQLLDKPRSNAAATCSASSLADWDPDDIAEFERLLAKFVASIESSRTTRVTPAAQAHLDRAAPTSDPTADRPSTRRPTPTGGLPQPPADPGGDGRPDGRHVPGRPRPEHRRRRPAQDHLRAGWPGQAVLGRHGVPADLDRGHPALGQDLRPARSPADLPGRDRGLPDRLGHLRLRRRTSR